MRGQSYIKNNSHQNNIRGGETKVMKKVLNTLLVLALIFTMVSPAFAADTTTQQKFDELKAAGVISGDANGNMLAVDSEMSRQQLAKIACQLAGVAATPGVEIAAFADDYKTGVWGFDQGWIQAAYTAGLMQGKGAAGFDATGTVTTGELLTVIVRSMGLESSVDTSKVWPAGHMEVAVAQGLVPAGTSASTNANYGDLVVQSYNSYQYNNPAPVTLGVESVTANNLKQVVVKYNKAVDEVSAETTTNYTWATYAGGITKATLQADGKTVVIELTTNGTNQAAETLTIKNVMDTNQVKIADTSVNFNFLDLTIPTAQSAVMTSPTTIAVTFSEPITVGVATLGNYKIDEYQYSISSAAVSAADINKVIVTLGSALPDGQHSITLNPIAGTLADTSTLLLPKTTLSFVAGADATAPTVSVASNTETTVNLKFNEAIDATTLGTNLYVRHTYNSNVYQVLGNTIAYDAVKDEYVVTFGSAKALPIGNVTLYLGYVNPALVGGEVTDMFGNALAPVALTFTNTLDVAAPSVNSVAFVDATHLDVTYSEPVVGGNLVSNYTLKDSSGASVAVTNSTNTTGNVYRLTTAQMTGGSYTLTIKNIKDNALTPNTMADTTLAINIADAVAPTVTAASKFSSDTKKVVISFSEAMATAGAGSILDSSMYVYTDGVTVTAFPTGTTFTPGTGNKSVIITFPAAFANITAGDTIEVGRVADAAGNKTAALSTLTTLAADTLTVANIANVKGIGTKTVTFDVNTPLSAIDVSKFTLSVGTVVSASYVNQQVTIGTTVVDGAKVTIVGNTAWATNATPTVTPAAGAITSALGTASSAIAAQTAVDYIAPAITSITTGDNDLDGKIDRAVIVYTENLNVTSVDDNDYTVAGYTVTDVALAAATVTLTLTEVGFDTSATPVVTQVGVVSDSTTQKNELAAGATIATTDGAAPVLVDAVVAIPGATAGFGNDVGDAIQLVFSEPVNTNFAIATAPTVVELEAIFAASGGAIAGGTVTATDLSTTASNTLILTTATALTNPIVAADTITTDAGPTANDIEDALNITIAAAQTAVTVR